MSYLVLGLILIVVSFIIARLGCMGVYRPIGGAIFVFGVALVLCHFNIISPDFILGAR